MTAFDRSFDGKKTYELLFEDGSCALFMPGLKDLCELGKNKLEIGKDFKRITLF